MKTKVTISVLAAAGLSLVSAWAPAQEKATPSAPEWAVPDIEKLPDNKYGRLVRLGRQLVERTYQHIGPEAGDPAKRYAGNNLACASCHIDAGTKRFGNPFVGTFADYPQYRPREDDIQTVEDRINGCMERSMNGKPLPLDSREMKAMTAYMKFMSTGVPVGKEVNGRGLPKIALIERAADPAKGKEVYVQFCAACHGAGGEGQRAGKPGDGTGYAFPPLWGPDSYNSGAGMNRTIMAARFIKYNMPKGVSHEAPVLTDEQAFDVAAYINSQARPSKGNLEADFPARRNKPVDAAFPPYRPGFSAEQHKYGPYKPIVEARDRELKAAAR
jgi:thiosulfate dehydrogenase